MKTQSPSTPARKTSGSDESDERGSADMVLEGVGFAAAMAPWMSTETSVRCGLLLHGC